MGAKWGVLAAVLLGGLIGVNGPAWAQGRTLSGTVKDSLTGEGIEAARISVQGSTIVGSSNRVGEFTLTGVPAGAVTLLVRAVGYRRREVPVDPGTTSVAVALSKDVFHMEEIVVTGQATGIERRNLANAVATIGSEDLSTHPTASLEQQLQGKVAGADISTNSGAPGGGVQVRLRGVTSLTGSAGGSNPSLTQDGQVNRIADINPAEIESIEILKGASAAAIYGGRAANGVVIIHTKRGLPGTTRVQIYQRFGYSSLMRQIGSRRFADAADVDGSHGFPAGTGAKYCGAGACPYFNHEEQLGGQRKLSAETTANITGGTDRTRYYVSGTYENEPGVIVNTAFARQSVRLNLDRSEEHTSELQS